MATELTLLNQISPAVTIPVNMFSPKGAIDNRKGEQIILRRLWIANTSNANVKYSIYFANKGQAAANAVVIALKIPINGNRTIPFDLDLPMRNSKGILYVQTDKADALTFTLTGDK